MVLTSTEEKIFFFLLYSRWWTLEQACKSLVFFFRTSSVACLKAIYLILILYSVLCTVDVRESRLVFSPAELLLNLQVLHSLSYQSHRNVNWWRVLFLQCTAHDTFLKLKINKTFTVEFIYLVFLQFMCLLIYVYLNCWKLCKAKLINLSTCEVFSPFWLYK